LAYTVNRLGTWFGYVALAVVVFDHTHSAVAVAALLVAGQVLSAFLVPAVVARVESSPRRGMLSGLYLFETAATAALVGVLEWHFSLPAILLLVALDGTAALAASALLRAAAASSAREWAYASHPSHITPIAGADEAACEDESDGPRIDGREAAAVESERSANAALNIGFATTFTLGPAIAGLVVPAFGAPAALLIDIASFLICGAMLLDLEPRTEEVETASVRARVRAAWQYIGETQNLRRLLLAEGVALTFFTFSGPVEVAYAKASLHAGDSGFGLLVGVWGLGSAIGSVVFARSLDRSLTALLSASTLAVGLAYLGWSAAPSLAVALPAGLLGGIGNGVQWASLISAVQRLTPQRLHGRLMGAVESLGAICPAVGFSLGGAIAAIGSPRVAFLVAGIGATLSTTAFVRLPLAPAQFARANLEEIEQQPKARAMFGDPAPEQTPTGDLR